jgi:TonB family protein
VTQVKSNWNVPESFQKGHVVIQFNVLRNGTLTDIRVIEASDVPGFNSAALNALRLTSPTLDLPKEYPLDKVLFTVTFHYNEGVK